VVELNIVIAIKKKLLSWNIMFKPQTTKLNMLAIKILLAAMFNMLIRKKKWSLNIMC